MVGMTTAMVRAKRGRQPLTLARRDAQVVHDLGHGDAHGRLVEEDDEDGGEQQHDRDAVAPGDDRIEDVAVGRGAHGVVRHGSSDGGGGGGPSSARMTRMCTVSTLADTTDIDSRR